MRALPTLHRVHVDALDASDVVYESNARDLRDVKVRPGVLTGSIRTLGIGGFFGYIGRFRSRLLGNYQAYVTDSSRAVVLRFKDDTLVISPDDPAAFVSKVYQLRAN